MTQRPVAVVTGASRGIGSAIARRLARDGYYMVLVSSTTDGASGTLEQITASGGAGETQGSDLRDPEAAGRSARGWLASFGRVDALVNNAGIAQLAPFEKLETRAWNEVLAVNLQSVFELTRALLPGLREAATGRGDASIVNVGSVMGLAVAPGNTAYSVSKSALQMLTRTLAVELGPAGIRVNAVAPGFIRTDMFERSHPRSRQKALGQAHPLGRVGNPEEVASVVSFLCSSDASFVSGAVIPVDGALTDVLAIPSLL